jgi:eukaryotic-like serine/threonine-protein kinase
MDFAPGVMIGGKYRLERKIAEGGMGEVWIAVHAGTRVAIKRLLADASRDRELVTRFRREALLLGKIESDHVSRVVEQVKDPAFGELLVMEYVEGESLADLVEKQSALSVESVIELGLDLTLAVADLHRSSIVHRDIKPENVILKRLPSGERRAVLIDFGLARLLDAGEEKRAGEETLTGITRAETAVGTIAYMAPEQILSSRDVSRAADVYSVGAILYRAASGRNVFGDVDDLTYARHKLNQEAPPVALPRKDKAAEALERIITRAVKRRPVERYDVIEAMRKDLAAARDEVRQRSASDADEPTQAAPVSSLLGAAASQISLVDTVRPPKPSNSGLAEPLLPGQTQSPGVAPVPLSPAFAPTLAGPPATHTMPMPPSVHVASPSPPAMHLAPPPVPPSFARPSIPGTERVGAAALRAQTMPGPLTLARDTVPRKAAIVGAVVALVVGFGVGFVLHAAVSQPAPADCPPAAGAGKTPGR